MNSRNMLALVVRTSLCAVVSAALLACAGSRAGTSTSAASPPPTSASITLRPTNTPATTEDPNFLLVALGDSIPGGLNCSDGCTVYVEAFATMLAEATGQQVDVLNLATNDSLTSSRLLNRVQLDSSYRAAIAKAELITIQIGFNDFQGPCFWTDHEVCLARGAAQALANLRKILALITAIREGATVPIRVITYYNNFLGDPHTATVWGFDPTPKNVELFDSDYGKALDSLDAGLCAAAKDAGAICVDLLSVFNGRDGNDPATGLVSDDGVHPTAAGHVLIAQTLFAAGLDDVKTAAP